jgi:hypothetical protein
MMGADTDNDKNNSFVVVGIDDDYTLLHECGSSSEAKQWAQRYVGKENAGGWPMIEVYDMRAENGERIWTWERDETNGH